MSIPSVCPSRWVSFGEEVGQCMGVAFPLLICGWQSDRFKFPLSPLRLADLQQPQGMGHPSNAWLIQLSVIL